MEQLVYDKENFTEQLQKRSEFEHQIIAKLEELTDRCTYQGEEI